MLYIENINRKTPLKTCVFSRACPGLAYRDVLFVGHKTGVLGTRASAVLSCGRRKPASRRT